MQNLKARARNLPDRKHPQNRARARRRRAAVTLHCAPPHAPPEIHPERWPAYQGKRQKLRRVLAEIETGEVVNGSPLAEWVYRFSSALANDVRFFAERAANDNARAKLKR